MSMLLLTMGPNLSIMADIPAVGVGSPGVIRFRPIEAIGPVKWTLVDSTLPAEWDSALNPDGNAVTLTTSDAETAGTFSVTVRAVDNARIPVVRSFDVRVVALPLTISGTFPEWEVGQPVSGSLTISGGMPPYSGLAITSGALPSGVSLSIVGNQIVPSGAPTVAGPWSATVQVSDSLSTLATNVVSGDITAVSDPYWEQVVALLHFDGPDGSTTFTDQTGKVWTPSGNAQIDTAQSKFGGASGLFDGSNDYITTASHADFGFGAGDFTVEMFARQVADVAGDRGLFCVATTGGLSMGLQGGKIFAGPAGVSYGAMASSAISTGVWYHLVACRHGSTIRIFVDGIQVATAADSYNYQQGKAGVGAASVDGYSTIVAFYSGHIDELRITKGVARYTANFTPPDRAFPDQ